MRIARRVLVSLGTLVLSAAGVAACGGLAHSVSNDGNDVTNPLGQNPGTPTLSLTATTNTVPVGSGVPITPTYDGQVLINNGSVPPAAVSDSSVISGSAFGVLGLSVGGATITATYQGSSASISFSVVAQNGIDGIIYNSTNSTTGVSTWFPGAMHVETGSTVQFAIPTGAVQHNVTFDPVPGAPPNIPAGVVGDAAVRVFSTAGSFPFHCTIHGEAGVVNVIAP